MNIEQRTSNVRRRALESRDSFFAEDGHEAIKNKGIETVSDMLDKYYSTIYLENIKIHSEEKQKKMIPNVKGRLKHLKKHIGRLNPRNLDMNAVNKYNKLRRKDLKPNGDHYSDGSINFELNLLKASVKVLGNGLKFNIKANIKDHIKLKQIEREVVLTDEQLDNMIQKFAEYDNLSYLLKEASFYMHEFENAMSEKDFKECESAGKKAYEEWLKKEFELSTPEVKAAIQP
jgi:LEA14-like dessication related protein